MKKIILFTLSCVSFCCYAQVGINTTNPNAQLDIRSSNQVAPTATDGMLIPKVDTFPAVNPTNDQQGMLVYLTTISGSNPPGFYYWNNPTTAWIPIKGNDTGTLDQAYDFGGAGAGNAIIADAGAVTIGGTDGFVSTGTFGSGAIAPNGSGTRMLWNPRKYAFRAGRVVGNQWDDSNVGPGSTAFGEQTIASGPQSAAFGLQNIASGLASTAFGSNSTASGIYSTAFGSNSTASGVVSTAFGIITTASGDASTAFGRSNTATSYGETVLGIGATTYTPSTNGNTQFRIANATDRLFVIGNAIDVNNNGFIETSERSDAMVVLKNGATGIGSSTPNALLDIDSNDKGILVPRVALTSANVEAPITNPNGGALTESTLVYNTVTAGVGENEITPGFHYWNGSRWIMFDTNETGKSKYYTALGNTNAFITNIKNLMPQMQLTFTPKSDVVMIQFSASGSGVSGQRAIYFDLMLNGSLVKGFQTTTEDINDVGRPIWDINILYPVQVTQGVSQTISINWAYTGSGAVTSHVISPQFVGGGFFLNAHRVLTVIDPNGGASIETTTPIPVTNSFWSPNGNSGLNSLSNFIGTNDNTDLCFRRNGIAAGGIKVSNTHLGVASLENLIGGINNAALGTFALNNTTTGNSNIGIGNSALTTNTTGNSNIGIGNSALTTNTTGNFNTGIGSLANVSLSNLVNASAFGARAFVSASNSLVLGSVSGINGATETINVGIGTTTPQDRLHVVGNIRMVDGNQALGRVLTSNANGTASWETLNLSSLNGWSTTGNTGLSAATNFIGTTNNVDVIFRRNNERAGRLGADKTSFGLNALNPNTTGFANTAVGYQALRDNTTGGENTAIGYNALALNLTGSNNTAAGRASLQENSDGSDNTAYGYQSLRNSISGGQNTALGRAALFNSIGNGNTGIGRYSLYNSEGNDNTAVGLSAGSALTTGNNNIAIGNNAQVAVATNDNQVRIGNTAITLATTQVGWTVTSDRRWKSNILPSNLGLDFIKNLKPVYYTRNNDESNKTEYGFIAQEMEEALQRFEASNNGIISKDDEGMYGVRYNDLLAPIVKAMQEQQEIIEQQNEKIIQQNEKIELQKNEMDTLKQQFQEHYNLLLQRIEQIENH